MKFYFSIFVVLLLNTTLQAQPLGSIDPNFNGNGYLVHAQNSADEAGIAVDIQSDDKIIIAGYKKINGKNDFYLARIKPDATLDSTFGTNGMVTTDISLADDQINDIAIQTDGKIVAVGQTFDGVGYNCAAARYLPNGQLDTTFSNDGKISINVHLSDDFARRVKIQNDGKIIMIGSTPAGIGGNQMVLIRLNSNGSYDNTFGANSILITNFASGVASGFDLLVQNDGKIIAAGNANNTSMGFAFARFLSNGQLDASFGTGGMTIITVGSTVDGCNALALQNDGKILAGGFYNGPNGTDFTLMRLTTNGSLDNSFAVNGIATKDFSQGVDQIFDIKLQDDGRILVLGMNSNTNNANFVLGRYKSDGVVDSSFATNGFNLSPISNAINTPAQLAVDHHNQIYVVGNQNSGNEVNAILVRYYNNFLQGLTSNNSSIASIQLFPNPANAGEQLTLLITSKISLSCNLKLYNALGQAVSDFEKNDQINKGSNTIQLHLPESLSSGIYSLRSAYFSIPLLVK